jgi:hypothetical protein
VKPDVKVVGMSVQDFVDLSLMVSTKIGVLIYVSKQIHIAMLGAIVFSNEECRADFWHRRRSQPN